MDRVRADVENHHPADDREARSRRRILRLLTWLPRPLDETADPCHVTASAIVRADDGRVLLHRHRRLHRWLQPGGHLDPGEHPAAAAVRETYEETGAHAQHLSAGPHLVHVDVHEGPRGHVHLDLRYLLVADATRPLRPAAGESPDVAWFAPAQLLPWADASLAAAVRAAVEVGR